MATATLAVDGGRLRYEDVGTGPAALGGQVALKTAALAPARVRALVLLDSLLEGAPWDDESKAGLVELGAQLAAGGVAAGRKAWLSHPLFAAAGQQPAVGAALTAMVGDYPGQHWLGQDPHVPDSTPPIEMLDQLTMPALVVAGERDVPGFLAAHSA